MRLIPSHDISALLRDEALPPFPCAIDGDSGLAYYHGTEPEAVISSGATAIICREEVARQLHPEHKTAQLIITSDNPLSTFTQIAQRLYSHLLQPRTLWIHNPDGSLPDDLYVQPGAIIYDNVTIGDGCVIGANCVIGDAGFGFSRDSDGHYHSALHFGGVTIGDNAEIGPGCVIDCGTFENTSIGANTRIDNLVQIAHNVSIGDGSRIMASVSISGGVTIGRDCWIAPGAIVRDKITIGDHVLVGTGSVVTIDVPSDHRYQPLYGKNHECRHDPDWEERL